MTFNSEESELDHFRKGIQTHLAPALEGISVKIQQLGLNQVISQGIYKLHNASINNTSDIWAEGTGRLGEGRSYNFGYEDRSKISVRKGTMVQDFSHQCFQAPNNHVNQETLCLG